MSGEQEQSGASKGKRAQELDKVQYSESQSYNHGQGFETRFEFSSGVKERRCFLNVEGTSEKLTFTVSISAVRNDPSPIILFSGTILDEDNLISIRLLDRSRSLDFYLDPKPKSKSAARYRAEGMYLSFHFNGRYAKIIESSKLVMRRVESYTLQILDAWLKYRNYFTQTPNIGDEGDAAEEHQPRAMVGQNEVDFGGIKVKYTGCLASAAWLRLFRV
ncbi:MAG: hypothetical protein Q9219_007146 [cf. Caloplaca sp. 3 TL-2023]